MKRAIIIFAVITALLSRIPVTACAEGVKSGSVLVSVNRTFIEMDVISDTGAYIGEALYDPFDDEYLCRLTLIAELAGLSPEESLEKDGCTYWATDGDFAMKTVMGSDYATVNYRFFYTPGNFRVIGGEFYFEVSFLCKIFGFDADLESASGNIVIAENGEGVVSGDGDYYNDTFGKENIKWLSRIIQAEAEGEDLACKIAVGNVVLNRIDDPYFPSTVYDVIFQVDVDGTVQFTPTETEGIYLPPSDEAIIAAYACYEGANTAGMSEFFADPAKGDVSWFESQLTYVVTLGSLSFYADPKRVNQ